MANCVVGFLSVVWLFDFMFLDLFDFDFDFLLINSRCYS